MIKPLTKADIIITDWVFEAQQRAEQPVLLADFFSRALRSVVQELTGKDIDYDYLFTDSNKLNHNPVQRDLVLEQFKKNIEDKEARKAFLRDSIEVPKSFNKTADEIQKVLSDTLSNSELADLWDKMDRDYMKVVPWFYYPWYASRDNMLTNPVKSGLEKYRKEIEAICDFDEALLAIVFPIKKTNFQLEQEEMLKLVQIAKGKDDFAQDPAFQKQAQEYLRQYDWLTTFILSPLLPMTFEQLVERVQRALKESFEEMFALQVEATKKSAARAEKILAFITDPALLSDIADARELGYVLTAGVEEGYIVSARYTKFMQLVAQRLGVAFADLKYFISEEVSSALRENKTIDPHVIDARRPGFTFMMKNGERYVAFGKEGHELSQWIDRELNKIDTTLKQLKGQPACKGYAKGRVRVASQPSEAHALEEGEILVCPMTNPDYVPAMRRSAAIITDEGGLLSHAAIMSREFNKPCVIATKIATQLLKNGDMVEVDANTGIVKIL